MDNQQLIVTAEQIRDWCGRPDTVVTVRPVIDLNHAERIDGYHVPDRFRDHIILRDGHCRFPHCSRRAGLDADHITPYADGGPTETTNLAPLCRTHHILKTRSAWTYRALRPGHYLWTSPHGWTFLVDPTGSYPLTPPRGRAPKRRDADRGQSGDRASPRPPPAAG